MLSGPALAHAMILLKVATKTRAEARRVWPSADETNIKRLRSAYHACLLAARCVRRAADAWEHDVILSDDLAKTAKRLEEASDDILTRMSHLDHWTPPPDANSSDPPAASKPS